MNWQEPPEILLQQAQSAFERRDFLQVQKHIDEYHHDVQNNGYSWYLLGCAVYEQKIHSLALKYLTRAIHYHPNIHAFWGQRGYIWLENKQNHLAKADFLKALELDKTVPLTWYYLAKCTYQMQDYDEAIEYIDRCLTLDPQFWDAYNLKVTLLEVVGRLDEAHHLLNGLSEKQPNNLNFKWNLSLQSIQLGNFKRGWALYQTRLYLPVMWRVNKLYDIFHKYPEKTWHRGLSLQQKTILVYAEQGLGDIFFGVRYLLTLKRMADKVIFVTANETLSMLQNMGVCEARSWLLPLPDFDYHCALLSLPEQLEDLTNGQTYLQVQPEKIASWAKKVTKKPHTLRVGLVWMGGEHTGGGDYQELNAVRNITFVELATLNHSHIDFYSLQMGSSTRGEYELQRLLHWKTSNFIDLTQDILDFSDTAALIKQLDLVISVDTSIVHLAGGLGVPVWLLNRFNGDFRWFWSRWDSPWYQSLTLYNQPKMGSWHEVLAAIKADLQTLAGDHADLRVARGMEHAKKLLDLRMEVWCARANQLQGRQKYAEALIYYDLALKISPNQVAILLNKAKALVALNRLDLALEHYARCEQLSPDTVEIYIDRAVIWVQQLNWQEALSDNLKAQALSPKDSLVWYNSAICQQELLLLEDSLKSYQKSIELAPNYLEAQLNMTSVLQELCRYDEMLPILQKLCQTKADYVLAHWNLGLLYLRLGHYALGWELYEWRFGMENFQQDHLGRSISELAKVPGLQLNRARPGNTVYIYREQGLGDYIQMLRFIPKLSARGLKIILEIPHNIRPLLDDWPIDEWLTEPLMNFGKIDFQCSIMSLPRILQVNETNIPITPYIVADERRREKWRRLLPTRGDRMRVGVVMQGGNPPNQPARVNLGRNVDILTWAKTTSPDLDYFSLQVLTPYHNPEGVNKLRETANFYDFTHHIADFGDTAALIDQLDLVISVDTSVAHLAAAMGKPVWLLNRFSPDWRWQIARVDSIWYSTLTQYHQTQPYHWDDALHYMNEDLRCLHAYWQNYKTLGKINQLPGSLTLLQLRKQRLLHNRYKTVAQPI